MFGTAHEIESPAITPVNWHKGHKGIYLISHIKRQCIDLFTVTMNIELPHAESHLRTSLVYKPCIAYLFHRCYSLTILLWPLGENDAYAVPFCTFRSRTDVRHRFLYVRNRLRRPVR